VPPGSNTGDTLRLKGKGVPAGDKRKAGDQIVTLRVMLPEKPDEQLKTFIEDWAKQHGYDPRAGVEGHDDAR
jgi:DnaJ-class molecular chaperone